MAELGISISAKLIEVIGSAVIKEICDMWGYQSQLEDLKKTVFNINNVLLDAESKRELSMEARGYIKSLKAVVYDADDLFDEFLTLAEMNQLQRLKKGGKLFQKVRNFFSSKNKVGQAYRMSCEVKEIRKKLDGIVSDHKNFGFSVDYKPIVRRREETCSYVDVEEIIGRDGDKKVVIEMLLGSEDYGIVTIVGVGGLGKTVLAQLVFNDEVIVKEFPDPRLRLWVCVSDQDGQKFDVRVILCKILELVCGEKIDVTSAMELLYKKFQEGLRGKKYLLILDDVWNENCLKWNELRKYLMLGEGGSRIVVTTRSDITAKVIGDKHMHRLDGLSPENSWLLFESIAFEKEKTEHDEPHHGKVEIGEKIVKKCCNLPLAIKVVGSLLFGQQLSKWHSFEEIGLAEIGRGDDGVMSILKLSYHNLSPSLKNCFIYCGMFPKDFSMEREDLISLWIAQGYIVPLHQGQTIEDAAEEHFLILVRRCFFQDIKKSEFGDVVSVKIHDLMHDVAQEVGKEEIDELGPTVISLGDEVRHVYYVGGNYTQSSPCKSKVRSLISCDLKSRIDQLPIKISDWMYLRVLRMTNTGIKSLPNSIGKLLHLRYINLSDNHNMEELCDSITELQNLETLILAGCSRLRTLPKDFCKLVKLRCLDLHYDSFHSSSITIPSGMYKLTCLKVLPVFMVDCLDNYSSKEQYGGKLQDLKALINLKGRMHIVIGKHYREDMNGMEGEYLKNMKHLTQLKIDYGLDGCLNQESVMEKLEPHSNLKKFHLRGYDGTKIPKWGTIEDNWAISHSNLVKIQICVCANLKQIPSLSKLPFLESLILYGLSELEYMEYTSSNSGTSTDGEGLKTFFPSLKYLEITNLYCLKSWWSAEELVEDNDDEHTLLGRLSFPRLSRLLIMRCANLTSFPYCSTSLEELSLYENNKKLRVIVKRRGKEVECAGNSQGDVTLRKFTSLYENK